jgi:hypothetical protein
MRTCTRCKRELSLTEFGQTKGGKYGRNSCCRTCCQELSAEYRNRPGSRQKLAESQRRWVAANHEKVCIARAARLRKLKQFVLDHYDSRCACCGETEYIFLTVDHVNGNGRSHKRQLQRDQRGVSMYHFLMKNNFPDGYQILCYNCNCGRQINGGICPHEGAA